MHIRTGLTLLAVSAALAGCGSDSTSTTTSSSASPGALIYSSPLRVASLSASDFAAQLNANGGAALLSIPGNTPKCGIDIHYLQYGTVGGAGESTTATGALMIPTGGAGCSGPRPIVLYAHGTTIGKNYNIADITDPNNPAAGELALVATMYAAQGYIVVAPNYAGYDKSTLPYHPYLNAQQQSTEMINILQAARSGLPNTPAGANTSDSGKLFVTGYSQGGHVAMATLQAMQAKGIAVTAGVTMSGPYSMALFGDAIFDGNVNIGGTLFAPLLATSYQKSYGDLYSATTDIYNPEYATGIETLIPGLLSDDQLFSEGKLPETALFQADPSTPYAALDPISPASSTYSYGFDSTNYLIQTSYRASYLADAEANPDQVNAGTGYMPAATPQNILRKHLKTNDLRTFTNPTMPVMMCGGGDDPTVFFKPNAEVMDQIFTAYGASTFAQLDVDANSANGPHTFTSTGLTTAQQAAMSSATPTEANPVPGASYIAQQLFAAGEAGVTGGTAAIYAAYHGSLVPPACNYAARAFFQQFQ